MSLRLPSEIVVERFLPTARAMLATELTERGLTQQAVADRLGVTQAAVSNYQSGEVEGEQRLRTDARMQATVERVADGLADETMDEFEALSELLALVHEFEDRGPICELHEEEMPALRGLGCDLCVRGPDAEREAERTVLGNVRRAARRLATTPEMAAHVPNVGTNVAMALPDPTDDLDVAAIPGRLHAMRGRVNVPSEPEFGASQHVAGMVLAANDADPQVRGALNLATSEELLEAARDHGVDPLEFDADYEQRRVRLRERFEERAGEGESGSVPRVVFHRGAFGVEPVTYVLGETALDAAGVAAELVEAADGAPGNRQPE